MPGLRAATLHYQVCASDNVTVSTTEAAESSQEAAGPALVLPVAISLIVPGDKVAEGRLITGGTIAWWRIIEELALNPEFRPHEIGWRAFEELLAGAYERRGWKVTLTPRSGDRGRDIIATRSDIAGHLCIIDQAKTYNPRNAVPANDVRAMVGVLLMATNVTKAFVTTTSRFARGVFTDSELMRLMPNRLELREGVQTKAWLLANEPPPKPAAGRPQ